MLGVYERIPTLPSGGCRSDVLGAELFRDDEGLRIRDLKTGEVLPTYVETQLSTPTGVGGSKGGRGTGTARDCGASGRRETDR